MELVAVAEHCPETEHEVGKLGIWLFILSEIMLFGGFLAAYVMTRLGSSVCALGSPAWPEPGYTGGLALATLNTLILITSSYTMVRACVGARARQARDLSRNLLATITLGGAFLVVKGIEYSMKIEHGYFPGSDFIAANPGLGIFVSFYFALTGLHALHVVVGMLWNGFLCSRAEAAVSSDAYAGKVEYAGLYWHFVDLVWVFLFPLFYLI